MNYYQAVEKKAEHGGGWAYMQLNRREGAAIVCACGAGGWEQPGHASAEDAERCFYEGEQAKGIRWSVYTSAHECAICGAWTPDSLHAASNLIDPYESVCRIHQEVGTDEAAAAWLWERHPFTPGIQITASW